MLKRFLSKLSNLLPQRPPKNLQGNELPRSKARGFLSFGNQPSNQPTQSAAPTDNSTHLLNSDLLEGTEFSDNTNSRDQKIIRSIQLCIFTISAVFAFLLFFDLYMDSRLSQLKSGLDNSVARVKKYSQQEAAAVDISSKLSNYEKVSSQRALLSAKTDFVIKNTSGETNIMELKLSSSGFYLKASGADPLVFSRLITRYLGGNTIFELALKSADYDTSKNVFVVEMEGTFK
jgi:hypothetical protein